MKFGETFAEFLHGDQERLLVKCSHVEYKRLKKVLKSCRRCKGIEEGSNGGEGEGEGEGEGPEVDNEKKSQFCQFESCPLCDQMFFSELMKEASDVAGCFSSRVRRLLHLHIASGIQRYVGVLRHCFINDHQAMVQEGRMLIQYVTMNALAIQKILKKYDRVHCSQTGRKFRSKMRAKHIEILQSPWLIELGAFYMNFIETSSGSSSGQSHPFSCNFSSEEPVMTLTLPGMVKLEYNLTCPICLDIVFNAYALSCGHLFCKQCACSAASVMIFQGPKAASPDSKCPVCREEGVYGNAVHMLELDLLLKKRYKEYWKERLLGERTEMLKQSKIYWDSQAKYMLY